MKYASPPTSSSLPTPSLQADENTHLDSTHFQELMKIKEDEEKGKKNKKKYQEEEEKNIQRYESLIKEQAEAKTRSIQIEKKITESTTSHQQAVHDAALEEENSYHLNDKQEDDFAFSQILVEENHHHQEVAIESIEEDILPVSTALEEEKGIQDEAETLENPSSLLQSPPSLPSSQGPAVFFLSQATQTPASYTLLSPEALLLFEKMVSMITIMETSGIKETTLFLDAQEFAHSSFSQGQVILREYSTAPLSYNIEFRGNPLAADAFRKNSPLFQQSFQEGRRKYTIHRLEAVLLP